MSHRGRRREHGRVRKTVEVLISGLFGVGVVVVVLALLQGGRSAAPAQPYLPFATVTAPGADASVGGVQNAAAASDSPSPPIGPSPLAPAPDPGTAQGATEAQVTAATRPATPTTAAAPQTSAAPSSTAPEASPSASASSSGSAGLLGGLVGGVLGLL